MLTTNLGTITPSGAILCFCRQCNGLQEVGCSTFEEHAGSTLRRPADNIYLKDLGATLKVRKVAGTGSFLCVALIGCPAYA